MNTKTLKTFLENNFDLISRIALVSFVFLISFNGVNSLEKTVLMKGFSRFFVSSFFGLLPAAVMLSYIRNKRVKDNHFYMSIFILLFFIVSYEKLFNWFLI